MVRRSFRLEKLFTLVKQKAMVLKISCSVPVLAFSYLDEY